MDYKCSLPSLESLALTRIAIALWSQDDIRTLLANSYIPLLRRDRRETLKDKVKWKAIEDTVARKVLQLPQPKCLKEKITHFIRPVGLQILDWMAYHNKRYLEIDLPKEFCWSPQGTVDGKKTAEVLIKDENVHVTSRYKLACIYCLEDDIQELWKRIPTCYKHLFYRKKGPTEFWQQAPLVNFWTYSIKGQVDKWINTISRYSWRGRGPRTPYQYAFEWAVNIGYHSKVAAQYFWRKLASAEREECLVKFTKRVLRRHNRCFRYNCLEENFSEVVCFLLSQMSEEQQLKVLRRRSFDVLFCLLNWPWQEFFLETAKRSWTFLSSHDFIHILTEITSNVIDGYNDYNYRQLFGDFWKQSPRNFREHALRHTFIKGDLISKLLQAEDIANVKLILKDASPSKRKRILFCANGKSICLNLISNGKSDLMKLFVQECISSKNLLLKFKEKFKTPILRSSEERLMKEKDMRNKLFQVMDDLLKNYDEKRGLEESNSSPVKKFKLCT